VSSDVRAYDANATPVGVAVSEKQSWAARWPPGGLLVARPKPSLP
jgi:hypothetical protein